MKAARVLNSAADGPLLLTCEHASCAVPVEYEELGLDTELLRAHIGWDIGAAQLTEAVAAQLNAPAVLAGFSRLLIDCNRDLGDHDLIVAESHGIRVPGNANIDRDERRRRIEDFYRPYHDTIDAVLLQSHKPFLLSIHSFTPALNGHERRFDVGVLFDTFAAEAHLIAQKLVAAGLRVRFNEPYSGLDGLIFSARTHGTRHDLPYLELEVNNRLLRTPADVATMADAVARALGRCMIT